jgi:hypothetical protein
MPKLDADKFVLLFSSDWFRPYWRVSGFVPKPGDEDLFQQSMRSLVGRMMQDTDCYYDVSFAETRLGETGRAFLSVVEGSASHESKLSLIRAIVHAGALGDALVEVSMAFWDDYEATIAAINEMNLTSTEWDRYLVSLTPELPSMLQDFAVMQVLKAF